MTPLRSNQQPPISPPQSQPLFMQHMFEDLRPAPEPPKPQNLHWQGVDGSIFGSKTTFQGDMKVQHLKREQTRQEKVANESNRE